METLPQTSFDFEQVLTPEEQDQMTLNAILGSVEDLSIQFAEASDTRMQDEEIMQALRGAYRQGAELAGNDLAKTISIFNQMEAKLGAMASACNHNHLVNESLSDSLGGHVGEEIGSSHHHDQSHDHEDDDDEYEIDPVTGKRRRKQR